MTATLPTATDPRPAATTAAAADASAAEPRVPARRGGRGGPGAEPPAPARPPVRFRSSRPDLLLCGALLLVIVLVQGWNITDFPALSDDEGTYLAQAWAVQQGEGLAHYTYWYDHPPLGWIQVAGLTYLPSLFVPESMTVATMRFSMLVVAAASAVLIYVLARRLWLPRWAAGLAMGLFGLSPLSVVLQREIFLDNLAVMWILLAFCLAASPSRHLWHHFGAGLAAATAVLTKETMLVVLPALLVTMWRHSHRDTRKFAVTGAITACVLIGLAYPLYALLNGELLPGSGHVSLIDGITYQMGREGSGFILDAGSGSNGVLRSWLYYDTVLPLGGLAGAVLLLATLLATLLPRALGSVRAGGSHTSVTARALAGPALAAVLLALVALRPSGYLPAMYVIQALPFLALVLAGGAAGVAHAVLRRRRAPGERRRWVCARWALLCVLTACAAAYVLPRWYDGNRTALTADANAPYRQAAAWLGSEVEDPARTRVLLDDALWLDAVHRGYEPGLGAIWFYKADLDPAVSRTLPRGWRDIDYVVSSPTVRRDAVNLPNVKAALEHSTAVAVFGSGEDRIEIRRTDRADRADGADRADRQSGS
ncbi:ArnT family glycosyltransferase [Streptomyces sp. NPDC056224]|uniref:ArnT family glycosyltransferase n=1 Tax=Streptomyces sp. NPDC056224 TaxID=3345750 RepID=UPI0035DAB7AD